MKTLRHARGLAFLGATLFAAPAMATIMPPNNLHLEDNVELDSNVTEADFNKVIDTAEEAFKPIMKKHGGVLDIKRHWEDSTVNASAIQMGGTWEVNMYGGLARREEVTLDGFALVLCHEIGHHLAGFPFVSEWAANEGQADYYGTQACLRQLWRGQDNSVAASTVDGAARQACDESWAAEGDRNLCYRIMMAGRSLAELLAHGQSKVSFSTPDAKVVKRTFHEHPEAQCRLDTFVAGALCKASFDMNIIPGDEPEAMKYSCGPRFEEGQRPRCWFKENDKNSERHIKEAVAVH